MKVGFRVEGVRRDFFSGTEWVRVVRCGRPEVAGMLVRGELTSFERRGRVHHAVRETARSGSPVVTS